MATKSSQLDLLLSVQDLVLKLKEIDPSWERQCIQLHTSLIISEITRLKVEREPHLREVELEIRSLLCELGSQSSLQAEDSSKG